MLDDAHIALLPSRAVVDELRELERQDPRIADIAHARRGAPDSTAIVTLKNAAGEVVFQMVDIPLSDLTGRLFVGQLPGRATKVEGELDALVAYGVRYIFGLVPRIDLADFYRVPNYVEEAQARFGDRFVLLDVVDYEAPSDDAAFEAAVSAAEAALAAGEMVYAHCGAGCGRAGVFVSCLLVNRGIDPLEAIKHFRAFRGCGPETPDQVAYVVRYAKRKGPIAETPVNA